MEETRIGKRSTRQRDLIRGIVQSLHTHPTAEEVYDIARQSLEHISLGTVYRNLRLLASEGVIREVQFADGPTRFDGMIEDHEHFVCTRCGAILDISPTPHVRDHAHRHPQLQHVSISNYNLSYYGLCTKCSSAH
ncbi:MAG: transcriptional repressor [Bacteroidetes bacterium]|nr:transcriptional repressor [Bacteroidota bacterium]